MQQLKANSSYSRIEQREAKVFTLKFSVLYLFIFLSVLLWRHRELEPVPPEPQLRTLGAQMQHHDQQHLIFTLKFHIKTNRHVEDRWERRREIYKEKERERDRERQIDRYSVYVCLCVCVRERERERER